MEVICPFIGRSIFHLDKQIIFLKMPLAEHLPEDIKKMNRKVCKEEDEDNSDHHDGSFPPLIFLQGDRPA